MLKPAAVDWSRSSSTSEDEGAGQTALTLPKADESFSWSSKDKGSRRGRTKSGRSDSSAASVSKSRSSTRATVLGKSSESSQWDAPRRWTPKPYHERAVQAMVSNPAYGLLLDPGLGKTAVTLAAFKLLKKAGIVRRALVIAPRLVCADTWPGEIEKWSDFNGLRTVFLHGPKKEQLLASDADIFLLNPEAVDWLAQKDHLGRPKREWPGGWPEMLVIDESTRFKHGNTQRFKTLRKILGRFERRYILTGSPAPNGYGDLWGQIYLLDFGARLGEYITRYRNKYFTQSADGYGWVLASDEHAHAIEDQISDIVLRLAAEDYLDMPPLIEKTIPVSLPREAMLAYEQMEDSFVLQMQEGEISAANAGVRSGKLRQIANGRVYVSDIPGVPADPKNRKYGVVHNAKIEALLDLIEELQGQPLMIAYEFEHDLHALRSALGDHLPILGQGVTDKQARQIASDWNAGKIPLLLAHPASAGWGLNLQNGGHHLAWFSITWNLEHYMQLVARQWRQGQKFPVFVYLLAARGTVDYDVIAALETKDATQRALLEALKKRRKERKRG